MAPHDQPDETITGTDLPHAGPGNLPPAAKGPLPLLEVPIEYYIVEGEQGRGGIGVVMRARDRRTDRVVALKQLQSLAPEARFRFEREMRITAKLQHPGVVPVHETGRFSTGEPFYAMKLVQGRTLKEVIAETKTVDERLALLPHVITVAETIAYAHSQGTIHRDLKPSNVIVGAFGETVVIDWGLAKDLDDPLDTSADAGPYRTARAHDELTQAGQILGTPAYMPPEQARGENVDARADVYAIGAILYHVLGGRPPYQGKSAAVLDQLRSPGTDPEPLESIASAIPSDLVAIVRKAMAIPPGHRYTDARALADDLTRFQTGKLIAAKAYSLRDLLLRWLRRHWLMLTLAGASLSAMAVLGTFAVVGIARERTTAEKERDVAAAQRAAAEDRNNALLLEQARAIVSRDPTAAARRLGQYHQRDEDGDEARWLELEALERGVATSETSIRPPLEGVRWLAGNRAVAMWNNSEALIWDPKGARVISRQPGHGFRVSGDGTTVVAYQSNADVVTASGTTFGSDNFSTHLYVAVAPTFVFSEASVRLPGQARLAAISHDGRRLLASTSLQGQTPAQLVDLDAGTTEGLDRFFFPEGAVFADDGSIVSSSYGISMLPRGKARREFGAEHGATRRSWVDGHGKHFVLELEDHSLQEVDVPSERWNPLLGASPTNRLVAISEDGDWIAGAGRGSVFLRRFGDPRDTFRTFVGTSVTALALSRDGSSLVVGLEDGKLLLWQSSAPVWRELRAHDGEVTALDLSSDGSAIVSVAADGTTRTWSFHRPIGGAADHVDGDVLSLFTSDAGTLLVTDREIVLRDASGKRSVLETPAERIAAACISGAEVNVLGESGVLHRSDVAGRPLGTLSGVRGIACARHGAARAALLTDGRVEMSRPGALYRYEPRNRPSRLLALSAGGEALLVAGEDQSVAAWDLRVAPACDSALDPPAMNQPHLLSGLSGNLSSKTSGDVAASGLWAVSTGEGTSWNHVPGPVSYRSQAVGEHALGRTIVRLGRDGGWTFSGGADGIVWARDNTRQERHQFHPCHGAVRDLQPSPSSPSIVGLACADGTLRLLDVAAFRAAVLVGQEDVMFLQFSEDGTSLTSLDARGELWSWKLDSVSWSSLPARLRECSTGSTKRAMQSVGAAARATWELPTAMAAVLQAAVESRRRSGAWPSAEMPLTGFCCVVEGLGRECKRDLDSLPAWLPPEAKRNPSAFRYAFHGEGERVTVEALGDFDCDGVSSRVLVEGHVDAMGVLGVDRVDVSRLGF